MRPSGQHATRASGAAGQRLVRRATPPWARAVRSRGAELLPIPLDVANAPWQIEGMAKTTDTQRSFFIDMGWGDWRLFDNPQTHVTAEQVAAINALTEVEDMGASEPRFGDMTGEITVFHTDGCITQVVGDGTTEAFDS
jgi:hypothetical protein